jgi:hypothetical protein
VLILQPQVVKAAGATATFSYKLPLEEQLAIVTSITSNKFSLVFDTTSACTNEGLQLLALSAAPSKGFATTNDWSPFSNPEDTKVYRIMLGAIGRESEGESQRIISVGIAQCIPVLERLIGEGALRPMPYVTVEKGWDGVAEGIELAGSGKMSGKKVVVKISDE